MKIKNQKSLVKHSYQEQDVIFLLTDLTGKIEEVTIEEKERLIAQGVSYSEMISKEEAPQEQLTEIFKRMTEAKRVKLADYIRVLSESIYLEKEGSVVLVSLARAGTPFGILIKRYLEQKYQIKVPHYSVSIIRGRGIDEEALKWIIERHPSQAIQFVDGWTGKGSIIDELERSIIQFNQNYGSDVSSELAVLADPARRCRLYGTHSDINIPNGCLNSTVSGLISRTICRPDLMEAGDFHGAISLDRLENVDYSQWFVSKVSDAFIFNDLNPSERHSILGRQTYPNYAKQVAKQIQVTYAVQDLHKIKLSVGESARVLLRRKPRLLLIRQMESAETLHLVQLAHERQVPIQLMKDDEGGHYQAIALIEEADGHE